MKLAQQRMKSSADSSSKCTTRGLAVSGLTVYTMVVNTMGVRADADESGLQTADLRSEMPDLRVEEKRLFEPLDCGGYGCLSHNDRA